MGKNQVHFFNSGESGSFTPWMNQLTLQGLWSIFFTPYQTKKPYEQI
jgi:hypothetical protein